VDQFSHFRIFEITILDHEGKEVPFTRFGKRVLGGFAIRRTTRKVLPGASFVRHYNLARLFDLSEAGEYRITIRKKVHLERRRTITLEIKNHPLSLREPNRDDWARWRNDG
jgi:hypothetical protein